MTYIQVLCSMVVSDLYAASFCSKCSADIISCSFTLLWF